MANQDINKLEAIEIWACRTILRVSWIKMGEKPMLSTYYKRKKSKLLENLQRYNVFIANITNGRIKTVI